MFYILPIWERHMITQRSIWVCIITAFEIVYTVLRMKVAKTFFHHDDADAGKALLG